MEEDLKPGLGMLSARSLWDIPAEDPSGPSGMWGWSSGEGLCGGTSDCTSWSDQDSNCVWELGQGCGGCSLAADSEDTGDSSGIRDPASVVRLREMAPAGSHWAGWGLRGGPPSQGEEEVMPRGADGLQALSQGPGLDEREPSRPAAQPPAPHNRGKSSRPRRSSFPSALDGTFIEVPSCPHLPFLTYRTQGTPLPQGAVKRTG